MKKKVYIDVIRVISMLLVVLAHSTAPVLARDNTTIEWGISRAIVTVTEIAVPLFFMISGANILNSSKTSDVEWLFTHRLTRIFIPFLTWSILSLMVIPVSSGSFSLAHFYERMLMIYHKPIMVSYWFVYPLIGLYLISPFLKLFVDNASDNIIKYLLFLWFIFLIILPVASKVLPEKVNTIFDGYNLGKIIGSSSLGYFILGYRLSKFRTQNVKHVAILITAFLSCLFFNILVNIKSASLNIQYLVMLTRLNIPVMASILFVLIKNRENRFSKLTKNIIGFLAPLTYGIYLSHGIVIELLEKTRVNYLVVFLGTVLICSSIIFILRCIPLVRRIFT